MILEALGTLSYMCTIRPRLMKLRALLPEAKIHPAGSRYVCSPPVYGTDIDFLIYSEAFIGNMLIENNYVMTSLKEYAHIIDKSKFSCWRRGKVNLIVTWDRAFAEAFQTGTHISKSFNVKHKRQRVVIHGTLRGEDWKYEYPNMEPAIVQLLETFQCQHGHALHKAYRAKHGLTL